MFRDISIGQYFPGESSVHRMDPRMKLILTFSYVVMLFIAFSGPSLLVGALFVIIAYRVAGIPVRLILRGIKPIIPIVIITGILNMFFVEGKAIFSFWVFSVSAEGVRMAVLMALRILCLIAGTALMTYTTSPIALTDGIELLFAPLGRLGAPVHEIAMMMTITLRFIPTLIEETDKIMSAQKARGGDLESGNFLQRVRALIPILIPLFVSAFRRAEELALAMECRCYHGGEGRTRMRILKFSSADVYSALFMAGCVAAVVALNRLGAALWAL
ncbi:MAG: energy-coupling factor transporter transmembrane protein EcfT [Oscillospiraceae bacterium]|jgi:energy-coupling factor transport system permease protein|nr:energy-coupling factor transporter transmembrane protein EcfT [Oscillospiraceae bacterium]